MKTIQQVIDEPVSSYTGSQNTYDLVAEQIRERWGDEEVEQYDPYTNALTFRKWLSLGYRVKKGEKSLHSTTFVEKQDEHGNVVKIPRTVHLFYRLQVEKMQ